MSWLKIKESIQKSLESRELKNPNTRLNALENIEILLNKNLTDYKSDPKKTFSVINKNDLKSLLAKSKDNGKLNAAESSIINEIYYRI